MTKGTFAPLHRVVWPLAVAQVVVWAAMFYSFPALLLEWERDMGWSKTALSGALTLSLVLSAVLAPIVGRLIDHGYARVVFPGCALLGAVCLLLLSGVSHLWQFYAVWVGIGIAMAGALYEACFAVLTRTMGKEAMRAITLITLVGGFAGTVSFPSAYFLVGIVGWRGAVVTFSAAVAFVAVPLILRGVRLAEQGRERQAHPASTKTGEALRILGRPTFWLLMIAFAAIALEHGMLLTHLLPLLDDRGIHGETAILAASMIGPMQVVGRLGLMAMGQRISTLGVAVACYVGLIIATGALLGVRAIPLLVVPFVLFQGSSYGLTSITRPVITADFLGRKDFGVISGLIAMAFMGATAIAPTVSAFVWEGAGYDGVIMLAMATAGVGLVSLLLAASLRNRGDGHGLENSGSAPG